jgi:hypothetical protein
MHTYTHAHTHTHTCTHTHTHTRSQARLAARVLTRAVQLPSRDEREESRVEEPAAVANPRRAHTLATRQFDYCRDLARLGGFFADDIDRRLRLVEAVYKHVGATRPTVVGGDDWYRKVKYEIVGDASFVVTRPGESSHPVRFDVCADAQGPTNDSEADPWL